MEDLKIFFNFPVKSFNNLSVLYILKETKRKQKERKKQKKKTIKQKKINLKEKKTYMKKKKSELTRLALQNRLIRQT